MYRGKLPIFLIEYRYIEQSVDSVYSDEYREVELGCKPAKEDLAGKKSTSSNLISLILRYIE